MAPRQEHLQQTAPPLGTLPNETSPLGPISCNPASSVGEPAPPDVRGAVASGTRLRGLVGLRPLCPRPWAFESWRGPD